MLATQEFSYLRYRQHRLARVAPRRVMLPPPRPRLRVMSHHPPEVVLEGPVVVGKQGMTEPQHRDFLGFGGSLPVLGCNRNSIESGVRVPIGQLGVAGPTDASMVRPGIRGGHRQLGSVVKHQPMVTDFTAGVIEHPCHST